MCGCTCTVLLGLAQKKSPPSNSSSSLRYKIILQKMAIVIVKVKHKITRDEWIVKLTGPYYYHRLRKWYVLSAML